MGEAYFILKQKLEELGYNNTLPVEAVPLVECVLADLLQTTRSLQHYMDLSKEALMQRDSLMLEAEPYKCDNANLIQENNQLHKDIMQLKEENLRVSKEARRKIKSLSEELGRKEATVSKLQHDIRDLSLRGLCAATQSSRIKSKKIDGDSIVPKLCMCNDRKSHNFDNDLSDITKKIVSLEEKNNAYCDEIILLKDKLEHRNNEIIRLNMLLEGGRPFTAISRDCCNTSSDPKFQKLSKELQEMETLNDNLKKEIESILEKQHEAMLRALNLADKNKTLQEELHKVDSLALKVEDDCNKRLSVMMNEMNLLQTKVETLSKKNSILEKELSEHYAKKSSPKLHKLQEALNEILKENEALRKEIKEFVDHNKSLQDKILSMNHASKPSVPNTEFVNANDKPKCPTKNELQILLHEERKSYEQHIKGIQENISETMRLLNEHVIKCKDQASSRLQTSPESAFVRELHNKLCESEQKILMLRKENDEFRSSITKQDTNNKQNYKDIISQLNAENSELSKENILLSQQLSQYRNINSAKHSDRGEFTRRDIQKHKDKIEELTHEIELLKKDRQEYKLRYKETMDMTEKLKRDLVFKQNQMEQLQEENCSYKMTNRNGKASSDHLKEECNFLREQIKKMQTDVIKEKTLSNQIKNIQLETERSSSEIQNEMLCIQKKLSLSKDETESLQKKCKQLQSEIISLKNDKSNLIDNIRKVDQERDKLVIELDNKTEKMNSLEQKIKSQTFDISQLENEISELKRKLNVNKISEHKLVDNESQIKFLNGEILRLTQQFDTAIMENKHLQNSLADTNGKLKITMIEYDKSRKEVEGLKQQLQHYVAEIRRIEELLSQKEAERSDMLEYFASLSVEANILENTNHSLESESASKSQQLQSYISKIQNLESNLIDKESIIESQSTRLANMTCKMNALQNEVKLLSEEKSVLEQNISYLKQMCNNLKSEHNNTIRGIGETDSELKLYEKRIKGLSSSKAELQEEKDSIKQKLMMTEKLLSNSRREVVELKLALQDATSETKSLQDSVSRLSRRETEIHETTLTTEEFELPLMLDEIHEVSHEDDEDSTHYHATRRRFSKYTHSDTL